MRNIKRWLFIMLGTMMIFGLVCCSVDTDISTSHSSIGSEMSSSTEETMDILDYFELADTKIVFDENILSDNTIINSTVCLDSLFIYLKKANIYKKLDVEDFGSNKITRIDYCEFEPQKDKIGDTQYMENFRQTLYIGLNGISNIQELIATIREVESLDFVKEVQIIIAVDDYASN